MSAESGRWEDRIALDPAILVGKPVIKGTRLAVEFIIELLAEGWSQEEVLGNYPQLTREDILAALHWADEVLGSERVYPLPGLDHRLPGEVSSLVPQARDAILRALSLPPYLMVLYGSEARGEATPESDIDLLVVLDEDDPQTVDRVHSVVYDVMWQDGFSRLISVCIFSRQEFERQQQKGYSFIENVEGEGIVLWQAA